MKFLVYFFLLTGFLYSQTLNISGHVQDKSNGASLYRAKILLVNKDNPELRDSLLTNSSGNWSYILQITDVQDKSFSPAEFEVYQNYPNPFNPSTKISFSVRNEGGVKITVSNILGEIIDSRSFDLTAGNYNIDWESKGSAGVLFYTIEMNGFTSTKKMIQLDGGSGAGLTNLSAGNISAPSGKLNKSSSANEYYIITSLLYYAEDTLLVKLEDGMHFQTELQTVHEKAFFIDLHNDVLGRTVNGYDISLLHNFYDSDLPRFKQGGVDAQLLSVWVDPDDFDNPFEESMRMIDTFMVQAERYSDLMGQAVNADELEQLVSENKFAGVLVAEGGHAIEDDINKLYELYDRGVRYLTITWNNSTSWAVSAADPESQTKGLSDFGREIIRTMDSLGMIIDVSHTGVKTIEDILEVTKNPIIASHSGVRAIRNHTRNLTDDQIKSIANSGGVIGVVFYTSFLSTSSASNVTSADVVKHINYIRDLVGVDYIAIGADFDGGIRGPVDIPDVSYYPQLTRALINEGYSNEEIYKILGGNFMRVFRQVCK